VTFKDPSFQDRINSAAQARDKALAKLKAKPPLDEAVIAERKARQEQRDAREAEKAEARRAAREEEAAAKAAKAAVPPPKTEAELKAARDARYAARKARK
jgi:hypothetical protein